MSAENTTTAIQVLRSSRRRTRNIMMPMNMLSRLWVWTPATAATACRRPRSDSQDQSPLRIRSPEGPGPRESIPCPAHDHGRARAVQGADQEVPTDQRIPEAAAQQADPGDQHVGPQPPGVGLERQVEDVDQPDAIERPGQVAPEQGRSRRSRGGGGPRAATACAPRPGRARNVERSCGRRDRGGCCGGRRAPRRPAPRRTRPCRGRRAPGPRSPARGPPCRPRGSTAR